MTDTTDPARDFNERVLSARWTAVVNDEIGGWAVSTDGRTPADGGRMAADMVPTREIGEHIAALHAAYLDGRILPDGGTTDEQWSIRKSLVTEGTYVSPLPCSSRQEAEQARRRWLNRIDPELNPTAVLVRRVVRSWPGGRVLFGPWVDAEDQP